MGNGEWGRDFQKKGKKKDFSGNNSKRYIKAVLVSGAVELVSGTAVLVSGVIELISRAVELVSGTAELASGTGN